MVYFLRFCTKYDTLFSNYRIELIVALSSTNATKNRNRFEFYRADISVICLLINASASLVFPKNSDRNQSYFNLQKDFQRRKLIYSFFFPPLAVLQVGHTIYPRTPIETPRHPFTPQDAFYMVRKSFILFYMISYHEFITFL